VILFIKKLLHICEEDDSTKVRGISSRAANITSSSISSAIGGSECQGSFKAVFSLGDGFGVEPTPTILAD
jgi:hypothetical protein